MQSSTSAIEVDPPSPNSVLACFHVIEYVCLPAMLKPFEETAGFSLFSLAQVDKFLQEPMPLESHAKFIKETWGKSTISIRIPVPKKLSVFSRDLELQIADIKRELSTVRRDLETRSADFKRELSIVRRD